MYLLRRLLIMSALFAVAGSLARAQLVLNVDTSAKTLWFTGSDSGTPLDAGGGVGVTRWIGGTVTGSYQVTSNNLVTSSPDTLTSANLSFSDTASGGFIVNFVTGGTAANTFTGAGSSQTYNYAGASAAQQSALENLISTSLPVTFGTGFSSIAVTAVTPVPESSTYATLAGLGMLGFATWRRRAQTKIAGV